VDPLRARQLQQQQQMFGVEACCAFRVQAVGEEACTFVYRLFRPQHAGHQLDAAERGNGGAERVGDRFMEGFELFHFPSDPKPS